MHIRGRADDAYRTAAAVPSWHGIHRQWSGRADHPGPPWRSLGKYLQLRERKIFLEASEASAAARHSQFRKSNAIDVLGIRSATGGGGTAKRSLPSSERLHANASAGVR